MPLRDRLVEHGSTPWVHFWILSGASGDARTMGELGELAVRALRAAQLTGSSVRSCNHLRGRDVDSCVSIQLSDGQPHVDNPPHPSDLLNSIEPLTLSLWPLT
ncbi:hypothetical protein [Streptomyces sp. ID38640]|uniref:hypothetical protein n=1 Tax=Streptomyces sp. ID38640 TaxID=1265399 RepID=UPI001C82BA46|nr:hypothetical protein [Streptomyces sp. ID38640]